MFILNGRMNGDKGDKDGDFTYKNTIVAVDNCIRYNSLINKFCYF